MFKNLPKLGALAAISLILGATSASAAPSVVWDFSADDLQGWTLINGEENYGGDGINAGYTDAVPTSNLYAHDGAHVNFVIASPGIINFAGAHATDPLLQIFQVGGQGQQGGSIASPANRAEVLANGAGTSAANGLKGLALRNLTTGNYDYINYLAANGNPGGGVVDVTLADLAGVSTTDNYQLDFFDNDDGSWGWTRLNSVSLDETVVIPDAGSFTVFWDFSGAPGGDHGWKVENGFASFAVDGVHASTDGTDFAEDAPHATLIFRSPMINFSGTAPAAVAIAVDFIGGQGNQSGSADPANPAAVIAFNGGNSSASGQKGLAFLNLTTGDYDAVIYDSENGGDNPETLSFTLDELITAGIDATADYRLDFFENDDGTSGWTRLESVNLNAVVTPDPPEFTLLWDFDDGVDGDRGWKAVNGFASFATDGVHASTNGADFAEDAPHTTLIFRSPIVDFSGNAPEDLAIEVNFIGGQGNQNGSPAPADPGAVLAFNGGSSSPSGQKGLAFFNQGTGNYDAVVYDSEDGGATPESLRFTQAELTTAGVNAAANYRLDFFENDDGISGWTRLESVNLNAVVVPDPPSGSDVIWDFSMDDLQGWTLVSGEVNYAGEGINAGYDNNLYAHDGAHVNFVISSPGIINFGGAHTTDPLLIINQVGGAGQQGGSIPSPTNREDVLAAGGGNSAANGLKGLALRNMTTGNYDYIEYNAANGNPRADASLDLTTLLAGGGGGGGVNTSDNYQLDFFDNDDGSWGWTRLNSVQVDETAIGDGTRGGFQITEIDYAPEANEVTLTWNSVELATYSVKVSRDMTNWDFDLDDSILGDAGDKTTRTFDLGLSGHAGVGRIYFRVERLPPGPG